MPPKTRNRRKLAARSYKNYSYEMMSLAIEMVKTKKMSSYEAEKNFGIPRRTIEKKIKNLHSDKPGAPFRLRKDEELNFVKVLIVTSDYGAPLTQLDFRILVHEYLKKNNRSDTFADKLPGEWWVKNFIERHRDKLSLRAVQNIKRARAEKQKSDFEMYFSNLESVLENVPATHILNYDETNFSDDPGSVKCIFRRGLKHPERVMNSIKGCISVMFAATASGDILPPYVVYKSDGLWTQWVEGGPEHARFNRTKSGWFDAATFLDWFNTIILPWARKLEGSKIIIGDNLSSHINAEVIQLCEKYDIRFVLLPPNSTHLTQPLDVAFFGPLKKVWRKILTTYKHENPRQAGLNKTHFPPLLTKVMDKINIKKENVVSGFKATGIMPFNPQKVYKRIPEYLPSEPNFTVDSALLEYLKEHRKPKEMKKGKNKKVNVQPGKSISSSDLSQNKENETQDTERLENLVAKQKEKKADLTDRGRGKFSKINVSICGVLSDDEEVTEKLAVGTEATATVKQRQRSLRAKYIKKKKTAKRSKKLMNGSTTSEDIEVSLHSDSDIEWCEVEDSDSNIMAQEPDKEDSEEIAIDVRRKVDMIESEIFKEINKRDIESKEGEDKVSLDQEEVEAIPAIGEENKVELSEGDKILTRYYLRKWKYYIGVIKNINRSKKIYKVSYYKIIRNGGNIKFVMPKKLDEDSCLPENCIVKPIELLQISGYPEEYTLMNEDDIVYFD